MAYNFFKGNALSGGPNPPDGYFLAWNDVSGAWEAKPGPSGSFSAGGDLSGNSSSQVVIGIHGRAISNAMPNDGDVYAWSTANTQWEPVAQSGGGGGGFTAGGDLSGSSSSQTVIKINGATVPASGSLTTGNVLRVSGSAALTYSAINLAGGSGWVTGTLPAGNQAAQSLGGDLTGTTASGSVLKINGITVQVSPNAGEILVAVNSANSIWSPIYDGYIASGANIAGSKIAGATTGSVGVTQLARDLAGTSTAPTVVGIHGSDIDITDLSDGYILMYDQGDNTWYSVPAPSGAFVAGGDLSGTTSNQTVIAIQGNPVEAATLGPSEDTYVLTWVDASGEWQAQPAASGFTAGGDLSGSSSSQTVIKINGATVPASGALTTGNVLQVNGASALTYGPVNLAGGSNYVTGTLPIGNQASQTLGGDLTGTTALGTVLKINGVSIPTTPSAGQSLIAVSGSAAIWTQIYDGYIAASANIAGSKIASSTNSSLGVIQLAGDLAGTAAAPTVAKIQGRTVSSTTPTDGYVLTWDGNGSSWNPKESPAGGWRTAVDLDLTTQGNQTFSSNTTYSIAGITFTKVNSANEASSATLSSSGITFQPGSSTDYNGSTRTLPMLFVRFADVIPNFDLGMDVRVTVYNSALNNTANYDNAVLAIDTNSTLFGVALKRGHGTTGQGFQSFYNRSASNVSGFISSGSAPSSTNDVMIIEIPQIGNFSTYKTYDGDYTTDFPLPSAFNPHKGYVAAVGIQNNDDLTVSNLGFSIGAQRSGSGTSLTVRFARIKIEYRNSSATIPLSGSPSGLAGGDLGSTYPNPTVTKIRGNSVATQSLGASQDGYVLTWSDTDGYWAGKFNSVISYDTTVTAISMTIASVNKVIFVNTSSASLTITLPPSPTTGEWHKIKDYTGNALSNNLIISGNGKNIEQFTGGTSSTLILNQNYDSVDLVYNGTFWSIL